MEVPGLGTVTYDLAYGGNFYAILPLEQLGIPFDRAEKDRILKAGLDIMDAINATDRPVHPLDPGIHGCKHVQFTAPGSNGSRLPQRDGDPPGLVRPLAVRDGDVRPDGAAARPR